MRAGNRNRIVQFFTRITQDERLFAMGFCPRRPGHRWSPRRRSRRGQLRHARAVLRASGRLLASAHGPLLVSVRPLDAEGAQVGNLVLVHDMSFVARRSEETRKYLFCFFVGLGATVVADHGRHRPAELARLGARPAGAAARRRAVPPVRPARRAGAAADRRRSARADSRHRGRAPIARRRASRVDARDAARRSCAASCAGRRSSWCPTASRTSTSARDDAIEIRRPASGLVTALEPIMRACSGTWIAHGSGSADRDVVDRHDRVAVPAGAPGVSAPPRLAQRRRRKPATTTASRTKGSGRCATSRTCARRSAPRTGSSTSR